MVRIGRLSKIGSVTLVAVGVNQLIVAIDVTRLARCRDVSSCQGKLCRAMIECRRLPKSCRMTRLANMTESTGHVVRIRRRGKISRMTLVAARIRQLIVSVGVA
jgi:hypothetical protein